jgi:DNA polymerase-3 subunit epsilon
MKKHNLAFIDLETTGLSAERQEIIEIGCVVMRQVPKAGRGCQLELVSELDLKVKPEHIETAEPEALRVNGYNSGDWLFAADLSQALKALNEKAAGAVMISHNITFDWSFLERAFIKTGVPNMLASVRLDLLSMAFAKLYHDERVQRFNLRALAEHFGLKNEQAHTALSDIRTSVEIYKKLLEI